VLVGINITDEALGHTDLPLSSSVTNSQQSSTIEGEESEV
jgi:hypothetical protein